MILDTASTSTLHALAAARVYVSPETRDEGAPHNLVVYCSDQAHSSVEKGAMALGFGRNNVRRIATDAEFRMRPDLLAARNYAGPRRGADAVLRGGHRRDDIDHQRRSGSGDRRNRRARIHLAARGRGLCGLGRRRAGISAGYSKAASAPIRWCSIRTSG